MFKFEIEEELEKPKPKKNQAKAEDYSGFTYYNSSYLVNYCYSTSTNTAGTNIRLYY